MAAEERAQLRAEPSGRSARILAIATGTTGLLAVGVLMMVITPQRSESPVAISATTTPVTITVAALAPVTSGPGATEPMGLRGDASSVLATPIGDGRFALVTRASIVGARAAVIDVRLPSGRLSAGSIVTASDDAVIVALASGEPGRAIARTRPESTEIVTVMASPPITVAYDDVGDLAVEEGTAVVDDDGYLVGLCSHADDDQVKLIEVRPALAAATSVVP